MATFIDTVAKLQEQGLANLKQAQDAQLAALSTAREIVAQMATVPTTTEALPSLASLTELSTTFATAVFEQQKAYFTQLTGVFATVQKDATETAVRFAKSTTTAE